MNAEPAVSGRSLFGDQLEVPDKAPNNPLGYAPTRRPVSIRRTSSLDVNWPEGRGGPARVIGTSRDIATAKDGTLRPIETTQINVLADHRVITEISTRPHREGIDRLVGARAGGQMRSVLADTLPNDKAAGSPLYFLLDDLAGVTLVSAWAWSVWEEDYLTSLPEEKFRRHAERMENVCIGYRTGSSALFAPKAGRTRQNTTPVVPLAHPLDPQGWHDLPSLEGCHFRRARRIDVWREKDELVIDAMFQDSAAMPDRIERVAVHEYGLTARADLASETLTTLVTHAGTLPFVECPAAQANAGVMVGTPLSELRERVLERLRKTAGCTHLNDALRSLADVPSLAKSLTAVEGLTEI